MEIMDKQQVTLSRIQFIADVSQAAQCSASEFLIAMSLISDLASQVLPNNDYQEIFYPADEHPLLIPPAKRFSSPRRRRGFYFCRRHFCSSVVPSHPQPPRVAPPSHARETEDIRGHSPLSQRYRRMVMMKIYAQQGDTIDAICWRYYGSTQRQVEQVYLANRGLADLGPLLPHGQPVELPDLPAAAQRETVKLWD